jgi:hypothetical protein
VQAQVHQVTVRGTERTFGAKSITKSVDSNMQPAITTKGQRIWILRHMNLFARLYKDAAVDGAWDAAGKVQDMTNFAKDEFCHQHQNRLA